MAAHPILRPVCGGSPADDDPVAYDQWSRRLEKGRQASEWQDRLEQVYWFDGDQMAADAGLAVG